MRLLDGVVRLSPSDLAAHLNCAHKTTLELRAARGEIRKPKLPSAHGDLLRRKGNDHEAAYLQRLFDRGLSIVRIPTYDDPRPEGVPFDAAEARRLTEEAIRAGAADVIYQPYLVSPDGRWRGFADFLEKQPGGGYEPVDTKLARSAKPAHVLQLLFYAEQVERLQGRPVEHVHVENGLGERETFRVAEVDAYNRRVRGRFLQAVDEEPETYGWRNSHCGLCDFRHLCHQQRVDDDHLTLVAGLRRSWAETLIEAGITTLAALGDRLPDAGPVGEIRPETLEGLRHQASLQLHHRRTGEHRVDLLPPAADRGFDLLPAPDPGDVWFDMEGHPFYEPAAGLEFLFGWCYRDDNGEVVYRAEWARDRDDEARAFAAFVEWVVERRRRHPGLHVYHYANYERSALTRLMGEHGLCEAEVDAFLREEVLVDLYRVVKGALRASVDSYSIKAIEKLYGFERTAEVAGGDEAVVAFETWSETGDDALLEEVERYNEEDCRSTVGLHEWLVSLKPEELVWRLPPDQRPPTEETVARDAEREALRDRLLAGTVEGEPRRLLGHLVEYHRREMRPQWWEWFQWPQFTVEELIRNRTAIGGLEPVGEPEEETRSLVYTFSFPEQEHKIDGEAADPATGKTLRVRVDDDHGVVQVLRARDRADEPLPTTLVPNRPISDAVKREALGRFADAYAAGDFARYPALVDLLERRLPDARLDLTDPVDVALSLGQSYLCVQGPPGSGKTWQGARMAIALMRAGKRVGVTSLSHKAILNLLRAIQYEADRQGFSFTGIKKARSEDCPDTAIKGRCLDSTADAELFKDARFDLVAGTGWAFAPEVLDIHEHVRPVDVLFVDEAGQLSLADVLAAGTAARSLILLGDPNQLPQVSQGSHPEGSERSVLQHVLGEDVTIPPDRGIFLAETWRLRPELCAFTSDAYYEGRLRYAPAAALRALSAGVGPAWIPVAHTRRGQSSIEEADAVASAVRALVGTPFTDQDGVTRPLRERDVLVVAPYNAQVRALRSRLPATVPVGTVDKFQGQEAPVVFVSMASSTADDAPRGVGFAFDANRFNVATSRAQCRAVLVCAPALLDVDCHTIAQMRLVSAVCRFVELGAE